MKSKVVFISIIVFVLAFLILVVVRLNNKSAVKEEAQKVDISAKLYSDANALLDKGEYLSAKEKYEIILTEFTNSKYLSEAKNKLEDVNLKIIVSGIKVEGKTKIYEIQHGDSLDKIAKKFHTTVALIKKSNSLTSDLIHPNQKLRIWSSRFSCVADKSQNILILKADEDVVKTYSVSTGLNNSTPVGTFKVVNKLIDPVWYNAGAIVLPESADNILGSRWLGFNISGYGIHGTTEPETIGQQITQGCIRMRNKEVEQLYDLLPVGTEITIID